MNVILWTFGSIAAVAIIFAAAAGTYAVLKGKANELNTRRDENGNLILLDTPSMRIGAASAYDQTIEMEKRGHANSDGMSWNDRWLGTIRSIRKIPRTPSGTSNISSSSGERPGFPNSRGSMKPGRKAGLRLSALHLP